MPGVEPRGARPAHFGAELGLVVDGFQHDISGVACGTVC